MVYFQPKKVDWNYNFDRTSDKPHGMSVFETLLMKQFGETNIKFSEEDCYNTLADSSIVNSSYIFVNQELSLNDMDLDRMSKYVNNGNDVLIVTEHLPDQLFDSLQLWLNGFAQFEFNVLQDSSKYDSLKLLNIIDDINIVYEMQGLAYHRAFYGADSLLKASTLGIVNQDICFVKVSTDGGNYYLHSIPAIFTNYQLLKNKGHYVSDCLSNLKNQNIIWDQYYLPLKQRKSRSPFAVLMQNKGFKWAYWIGFVGLSVYIIGRFRRRQRAIPTMTPYQNKSVKFVEMIGHLHFETGSNKALAMKQLAIFNSEVAHKYYLKDIEYNEESAVILSAKSGKTKDNMLELFKQFQNVILSKDLSDYQLKKLHSMLRNFYDYDS